jgi:manganese/zinc/iron transport system permease protein
VLAAMTLALFIALGRDLRALAFDEQFTRMVGRPAGLVSALVAAVIVCAIVAGTHAVGLVLVVALLVMPATAARMISDRYTTVVAAAACIGAIGAASGTAASAMLPGLATGPLIVIACAALLAAAVTLRRLRRAVGSAS